MTTNRFHAGSAFAACALLAGCATPLQPVADFGGAAEVGAMKTFAVAVYAAQLRDTRDVMQGELGRLVAAPTPSSPPMPRWSRISTASAGRSASGSSPISSTGCRRCAMTPLPLNPGSPP